MSGTNATEDCQEILFSHLPECKAHMDKADFWQLKNELYSLGFWQLPKNIFHGLLYRLFTSEMQKVTQRFMQAKSLCL